jgi:predicted enzyme related to lactoylglutathione lyase
LITSIAFSAYPVQDMARARQFYEAILGLTPAQTFGEFWQEYDLGNSTFCIVHATESAPEYYRRPGSAVAFEVTDLDVAYTRMQEKGVTIIQSPMDFPACRMMIIADPDQNIITFHQLAKTSAA